MNKKIIAFFLSLFIATNSTSCNDLELSQKEKTDNNSIKTEQNLEKDLETKREEYRRLFK